MNRLLAVIALAAVILVVFLGVHTVNLTEQNKKLKQNSEEANLVIGKAKTTIADLELKNLNLSKQLKKEIDLKDLLISKYAVLEAELKVKNSSETDIVPIVPEVIVIKEEGLSFKENNFYLATDDKTLSLLGPFIGGVHFDNRISIGALARVPPDSNKPKFFIEYELYLKLEGVFVENIDSNGVYSNYLELYEIDLDGKRLGKFNLTKFEVVMNDLSQTKFHLWMPKIDLGGEFGVYPKLTSGFSLGMSVMAYGKNSKDLSWRFLRLGASVNSDSHLSLGLSPALWNAGEIIPLISNLWIGPNVNLNHLGFSFSLLVNVGL